MNGPNTRWRVAIVTLFSLASLISGGCQPGSDHKAAKAKSKGKNAKNVAANEPKPEVKPRRNRRRRDDAAPDAKPADANIANASPAAHEVQVPAGDAGAPQLRPLNRMTPEQAAAEESVIAKIEYWGGKYTKQGNAIAQKLNPTLPVITVNLYANTKMTDDDLEALTALTQIRRLNLMQTGIGDAGMVHVGKMHSLENLMLMGTQITDAGMSNLTGLSELKQLYLEGTKVSGEGVANLKDLPKLRTLNLEGTNVDDKVIPLLASFPSLDELHVGRFQSNANQFARQNRAADSRPLITDVGVKQMKELAKLKKLYLYGIGITDDSLDDLMQMTQLEQLVLVGTRISNRGIGQLQQKMSQCKVAVALPPTPSTGGE